MRTKLVTNWFVSCVKVLTYLITKDGTRHQGGHFLTAGSLVNSPPPSSSQTDATMEMDKANEKAEAGASAEGQQRYLCTLVDVSIFLSFFLFLFFSFLFFSFLFLFFFFFSFIFFKAQHVLFSFLFFLLLKDSTCKTRAGRVDTFQNKSLANFSKEFSCN